MLKSVYGRFVCGDETLKGRFIMANIRCSSGPVLSMPGSSHGFPAGSMCDMHPKQLAVKRIQGETDSFGAEYFLACQDCVGLFRNYREQQLDTEQYCDWCKAMKKRVVKHRDMDEGSSGTVYNVCSDCRAQESQRATEELAESDAWEDTKLDDHEDTKLDDHEDTKLDD